MHDTECRTSDKHMCLRIIRDKKNLQIAGQKAANRCRDWLARGHLKSRKSASVRSAATTFGVRERTFQGG